MAMHVFLGGQRVCSALASGRGLRQRAARGKAGSRSRLLAQPNPEVSSEGRLTRMAMHVVDAGHGERVLYAGCRPGRN